MEESPAPKNHSPSTSSGTFLVSKSIGDYEDNHEYTTDLLPLIEQVSNIEGRYVTLSNVPLLHATQVGNDPFPLPMYGKKWSCGYRNIQMLWSAMLAIPEFATLLCNARLRLKSYDNKLIKQTQYWIPSIIELQELIELAWQDGFDVEGMLHFGGKLVRKSDFIGATGKFFIQCYLQVIELLIERIRVRGVVSIPRISRHHCRLY